MKKLIIWLLLFTSFTANAQLIGGGPRKPKVGGSSGTVTSVGLSAPTGLTVSGSPVTGAGTLALSLASGYSIPTTSNQANWTTAYGWGNHASAGYASLSGTNTFSSLQSFTGTYTGGQASFGSSGNGGNVFFKKGSDGTTGFSIGFSGQNSSTGYISSSAAMYMVAATSAVVEASGAAGSVNLNATNASGYVNALSGNVQTMRMQNGRVRFGSVTTDNSGYTATVDGGANFKGATLTEGVATFTAPWSDYQATFGQSGESARTRYLTTGASSTIGYSSQNGVDFAVTSNTGSGLLGLTHNGGTGYVRLAATGTSGTVRLRTQATERLRVNSDGTVIVDKSGTMTSAGYDFDVVGTARVTGILTLNDGTIEKTTAGNFTINGGAVAVNATFRANSGVLAGGTNSLDASSILEARSTSKGFLPPRMTSSQRTAISSPATGLIVYQTDGTEGVYVNTSTGWKQLAFVP